MAFTKTLPLDERIKAVQAESDAFLDARAAEIKKICHNQPLASIRNELVAGRSPCDAVLAIMAKEKAA